MRVEADSHTRACTWHVFTSICFLKNFLDTWKSHLKLNAWMTPGSRTACDNLRRRICSCHCTLRRWFVCKVQRSNWVREWLHFSFVCWLHLSSSNSPCFNHNLEIDTLAAEMWAFVQKKDQSTADFPWTRSLCQCAAVFTLWTVCSYNYLSVYLVAASQHRSINPELLLYWNNLSSFIPNRLPQGLLRY